MAKSYYVYIMASKTKVLYTGITNDIYARVWQHKRKIKKGFTARYNVNRLVYFAETDEVDKAIAYEKQIKGWLRIKKIRLIEKDNPNWNDLAAKWYD